MRILIRGGNFVNLGAAALLATVQRQLVQRLGPTEFYVVPDEVGTATQAQFTAAGVHLLRPQLGRLQGLAYTVQEMATDWRRARTTYQTRYAWLQTLATVAAVDAIVDISGYNYGDPWGRGAALQAYGYVNFARRLGKPYVFLPQAWGPFADAQARPHYRKLCAAAGRLYTRDTVSQRHVADLLGCAPRDVPLGPDIAFRLEPATTAAGQALLATAGAPDDVRPRVGLVPNRQVYRRALGTGLHNAYVQQLVAIARHLRRRGAAVYLLPHEIEPTEHGTHDDRLLCSMVAGAANDPHIVPVLAQAPAEVYKAALVQLDVVVSSRYHALVAALAGGRPALALGWSHKYLELLALFGLEDLAVAYDELTTPELLERVARVLDERTTLAARVVAALPAVQQRVDRVLDETCAILTHGLHATP